MYGSKNVTVSQSSVHYETNNTCATVPTMCRSVGWMRIWSIIPCRLLYIAASTVFVRPALAGLCWETIDQGSGSCRGGLIGNMTMEACCNTSWAASVAWSPYATSGDFFYNYYLRPGPLACHRCHKTCENVRCTENQRCRMVDGSPQCVCRPPCDHALKSRGRLCGSDGRKYRNYCALQKANCITEKQTRVEYYGRCRRSCKHVHCVSGQTCMEDQNGMPHCITCRTTCNLDIPDNPRDYVCAVDGRTYKNSCEIQAEICRQGRSVRLAYRGACQANASCALTTCHQGSTCLTHALTRQPVCVDCGAPCVATKSVRICGTDGRTYNSYCDMKKIGCYIGQYISTKRNGPCKKRKHSNSDKRPDGNIRLVPHNHIQLEKSATRKHKRRKGKHKHLSVNIQKTHTESRHADGKENSTDQTKKRRRQTRKKVRRLKAS